MPRLFTTVITVFQVAMTVGMFLPTSLTACPFTQCSFVNARNRFHTDIDIFSIILGGDAYFIERMT